MQDYNLEEQVNEGQAALGRLIRQFIAVNDFKHVQLMLMAHAVTGVRWLHSSQISTLKQGATRNLTGFPLYSLAAVNRAIFEINNNSTTIPRGTKSTDWKSKLPMLNADGKPLDIGDLWKIYFGEIKPVLFSEDESLHLDDTLAANVSNQLNSMYIDYCKENQLEPVEHFDLIIKLANLTKDEQRTLKGVLFGAVDLSAEDASELLPKLTSLISEISGQSITNQQLYELALESKK